MMLEQSMFALRAPPSAAVDARLLQKQTPIRTSLIVHRRDVGPMATLEVLGKKMGGTRRGVADNDGVNSHRLEVFRRVDERLPLGEAGP